MSKFIFKFASQLIALTLLSYICAQNPCSPGSTYSLNQVCKQCPDVTMAGLEAVCDYTGFQQITRGSTITYTYTLKGVSSIKIWGFGAMGQGTNGGKGGYLSATFTVNDYEKLYVVMGLAPDVRLEPSNLASRLAVAGAGGCATPGSEGGAGGGLVGGQGTSFSDTLLGGTGGTQSAGGTSPGTSSPGEPGQVGLGGAGYASNSDLVPSGGRGGDGWYGGGGGGANSGGGGGSSHFLSTATAVTNTPAYFTSQLSSFFVAVASCTQGFFWLYNGACVTTCPVGTYRTSQACILCNAGYSTPTADTTGVDASACSVCAPGYSGTAAAGTSGCTICPTNTYSVGIGNGKECLACSANTTGCGGTSAGTCNTGFTTSDSGAFCTKSSNSSGLVVGAIGGVFVFAAIAGYFCFKRIKTATATTAATTEMAGAHSAYKPPVPVEQAAQNPIHSQA